MTDTASTSPVPRWLRLWAVVTVVAALPLALLGAETTTRGVGMADQVSLRTPWYFFTLDLSDTSFGLLIEHGHRLFGWAVGLCSIVLALGAQFSVRDWRRWLGWPALVMVSAQGVLGILRVKWNALAGPELAAFHGCFAQLAFATLVAVAVLFSRSWESAGASGSVGKLAIGLCVLIYVQIIFGAIVRHKLDPIAQRLHIILAFGVVGMTFAVYARLRGTSAVKVGRLLHILVLIQPILGVEAWLRRFGAGTAPEAVMPTWGLDFSRSAHHLLGTVIFSTSVALAALLWRPVTQSVSLQAERPLEAA